MYVPEIKRQGTFENGTSILCKMHFTLFFNKSHNLSIPHSIFITLIMYTKIEGYQSESKDASMDPLPKLSINGQDLTFRKVVFGANLNVRFWHKSDVQPSRSTCVSNKGGRCGRTPSIGLAYSPVLEVLRKPTLTLFVKMLILF